MSVVNKMLQDLEARKSQPEELNADYQPPKKQLSKGLVVLLLVLALAAISFALLDIEKLFGPRQQNAETKVVALKDAQTKKPMLSAENAPSAQPEKLTTQTDTQVKAPIAQTEQPTIQMANASATESVPVPTQIIAQQPVSDEPEPLTGPDAEVALNTAPANLPAQNNPKPKTQPSFSMSGSSKENQSSSLKQRIAESLTNNDLDLAQSLLNQLLIDEPENLKARKKLASLYFSQGNYALTKQLLLRGIELSPNESDLRLMLARLYSVQNKLPEALNTMQSIQPNIDNQTEYLAYRAALAQQLKRPEVSKADYLVLSQIDATNARWWLGLGIAQDQLGNTRDAVRAYERAYSLGQLEDSVDEFIQQRISVLVGNQ